MAIRNSAARFGAATMLFHFESGALGTLVISESTPSPWSWEASVSDGMGYHNAGQDHARFIGTEASLSFPSLMLWHYGDGEHEPGWRSPLLTSTVSVERTNPYIDQIAHFARVVRGHEAPLVSGADGLRSLAVVDAVIAAARTNRLVQLSEFTD